MSTIEYKCELLNIKMSTTENKSESLNIKMSTIKYKWEPSNVKLRKTVHYILYTAANYNKSLI